MALLSIVQKKTPGVSWWRDLGGFPKTPKERRKYRSNSKILVSPNRYSSIPAATPQLKTEHQHTPSTRSEHPSTQPKCRGSWIIPLCTWLWLCECPFKRRFAPGEPQVDFHAPVFEHQPIREAGRPIDVACEVTAINGFPDAKDWALSGAGEKRMAVAAFCVVPSLECVPLDRIRGNLARGFPPPRWVLFEFAFNQVEVRWHGEKEASFG